MTNAWYIQNGFTVSALIKQAEIDRAEHDIFASYISRILPSLTFEQAQEDKQVQQALARLAFLLLLQRPIFATRAGAKEKTTTQSNTPASAWDTVAQECMTAHAGLEELRKRPDAVADAEVLDICKIYLKTTFFYC